jgi:hypothetical protein
MTAQAKLNTMFRDIFWRCGDCNNVYSIDIKYCPNNLIDSWAIHGIVGVKDLNNAC